MKKSKILSVVKVLSIIALCAFSLMAAIVTFGEHRYNNGVSDGFDKGFALGMLIGSEDSDEEASYTGPEAWMLNPLRKDPFWVERTEAEALALEVSNNVTVEVKSQYSSEIMDTNVPLSADESFRLDLVIDEEITAGKLHEMNCYYPKYVAAGETFEVRIVLEEENGKVYVGVAQLTAGDENLNLVHGSSNPDAWYGAGRVDCDEDNGVFSVYLYTGATEAHWERPMFAGKSGFDGIVHCNYHCLENNLI